MADRPGLTWLILTGIFTIMFAILATHWFSVGELTKAWIDVFLVCGCVTMMIVIWKVDS